MKRYASYRLKRRTRKRTMNRYKKSVHKELNKKLRRGGMLTRALGRLLIEDYDTQTTNYDNFNAEIDKCQTKGELRERCLQNNEPFCDEVICQIQYPSNQHYVADSATAQAQLQGLTSATTVRPNWMAQAQLPGLTSGTTVRSNWMAQAQLPGLTSGTTVRPNWTAHATQTQASMYEARKEAEKIIRIIKNDPFSFLSTQNISRKAQNPHSRDLSMDDIKRQLVQQDTIMKLNTQGYLESLRKKAKQNLGNQKQSRQTVVEVTKGDWGEITGNLTKNYGIIFAVLNMANAFKFGGGYLEGRSAQEENMFRRSDCSLDETGRQKDSMGRANNTYDRPMTDLINAVNGQVYLDVHPRVCFKGADDGNGGGYNVLPDNETFLFYELRSAAVDLRNGHAFDQNVCLQRIEAQFKTLENNGLRHVVLSAFGCGAFKNPPDEVAECYRQKILQHSGNFDVICFAIYDVHGSNNYTFFETSLKPLITPFMQIV
jgi:hypothetical protein